MPFTQKLLRFTFDLPATLPQGPTQAGPPLQGPSPFQGPTQAGPPLGTNESNRVTVSGLRASVTIEQAGVWNLGNAEISIYGLDPSLMNQLSTLGQKISFVRRNVRLCQCPGDRVRNVIVCRRRWCVIDTILAAA
jgi:hypothetical protein